MDDVVVRRRIPRHNIPARRKRKNVREAGTLVEKIVRQALICIVILVVLGAVKSINTTFTNYLTEKIKIVLFQDLELNKIFQNIDGAIDSLKKDKSGMAEEGFDEPAVPVTADVSNPEEDSLESRESSVEQPEVRAGDKAEKAESTDGAAVSGAEDTGGKAAVKLNLIKPVEGAVGSVFGERTHPIKKTPEFHKGIDIEANKGAAIKAVLGGTVSEAGSEPTFGNYLKISHEKGLVTVYAHCTKINVKKGQKVKQGDIVASVGNTGSSVGAHLHFELWMDGKPVNPLEYISLPVKKSE